MMDTRLTRVLSRGLQDAIDPLLVVDVPLHRGAKAGLEIAGWFPSKLIRDFRMIHRITPIMAQAVGDEGE